jgi:hypothetical protein
MQTGSRRQNPRWRRRNLENHIKLNNSVNFYPILAKFCGQVKNNQAKKESTKTGSRNKIQDGCRGHFENMQFAIN